MKTSNKILLGVFIMILLVSTAIQLALSSKYKRGEFTTENQTARKDSITIKKVSYVSINGLDNVKLIPSEAYSLETEKNMPSYFKYTVVGDTLFLHGDSASAGSGSMSTGRKVYAEVTLRVPAMALIAVENSNLTLSGKPDSSEIATIRLAVKHSRLSFENSSDINDAQQYFGDVFISAAQDSEIELSSTKLHFKTLTCDLQKSTFRDNQNGNIQKLMISTDDSSEVQLSGVNFQKLEVKERPAAHRQ
jgi:hypothetical protein